MDINYDFWSTIKSSEKQKAKQIVVGKLNPKIFKSTQFCHCFNLFIDLEINLPQFAAFQVDLLGFAYSD